MIKIQIDLSTQNHEQNQTYLWLIEVTIFGPKS